MRLHHEFEWDDDKAAKNLKKHGISFDDAMSVLADDDGDFYHIEEFDRGHSDEEERYITTASNPSDRRIILLITWTDRSNEDAQVTRIISARPATHRERKEYAKEIGNR